MLLPPDLVTPCLLVDRDVLDANIAAMARFAQQRAVALRPHAKTHKCPQIAARQLAAGACGLTVATVAEAEVFAGAGCPDLFIAYPLWVDPARGRRLRTLAERARIAVGVDSVAAAVQLVRHAGPLEVLVEVDSGHRRSGVDPAEAGTIARAARDVGLRVRGVFTFPGHAYAPGAARGAAAAESSALAEASNALQAVGVTVGVRSGGSTPSVAHTDPAGLTEIRPGVYVFADAQQITLGSATVEQIALVAVATVVSLGPDRVILDAGSKILGADRPIWAEDFGRVLGHPSARINALSEHHATVQWPGARPALGQQVGLIPNHVCAAVNLVDELWVSSEGTIVDCWQVQARGANT